VARHTDEERLTQVWFAGVHSDVGGGYPDDALVHVPLRWIADEACKKGLRLHPHLTADWKARADPNGPLNDSRRGLGLYYRYNPRNIQKLTNDGFADVRIPRAKLHESVLRRIAAGRDEYAPIVLPERYAVVHEGGEIVDGATPLLKHPTQSAARCADQERVWNTVWKRRPCGSRRAMPRGSRHCRSRKPLPCTAAFPRVRQEIPVPATRTLTAVSRRSSTLPHALTAPPRAGAPALDTAAATSAGKT